MATLSHPGAQRYVPAGATLQELERAAQKCHGCDLYRCATQAVLGEGPPSARIVFVGEQPGDKEDLAGRPFVGPAGAPAVTATVHPSAILRSPNKTQRELEYAAFVHDLIAVRERLESKTAK